MSTITHRFNEAIGYLEIAIDDLSRGLEYAKESNFTSIRIMNLNRVTLSRYTFDCAIFESHTYLERISINDDFKISQITNLEVLKSLTELVDFSTHQALAIDFAFMPLLKTLYIKFSPKLTGFESLVHVEDLLLSSFKGDDCSCFSTMGNVRTLRLSGNYLSLDGIEQLVHLKSLGLSHSPKLQSLDGIEMLPNLEVLKIERCKQLMDFSILNECKSMKELFLSDLDSVKNLSALRSLVKLTFWNCIDGDLTPLLQLTNLKSLHFYPQKKHYSHLLAELKRSLNIEK